MVHKDTAERATIYPSKLPGHKLKTCWQTDHSKEVGMGESVPEIEFNEWVEGKREREMKGRKETEKEEAIGLNKINKDKHRV